MLNRLINRVKTMVEGYKYRRQYLLRFESSSFIIVVDKKTGEYINMYVEDTDIRRIANVIDKHPKMEA